MAADHEYLCNGCGRITPRSMLTVKKVLFTEMGAGAKTTRARVKSWLCVDCTKSDPDWNLPKHRRPSERAPAERTLDKEALSG